MTQPCCLLPAANVSPVQEDLQRHTLDQRERSCNEKMIYTTAHLALLSLTLSHLKRIQSILKSLWDTSGFHTSWRRPCKINKQSFLTNCPKQSMFVQNCIQMIWSNCTNNNGMTKLPRVHQIRGSAHQSISALALIGDWFPCLQLKTFPTWCLGLFDRHLQCSGEQMCDEWLTAQVNTSANMLLAHKRHLLCVYCTLYSLVSALLFIHFFLDIF